jgi:hypothetical protein
LGVGVGVELGPDEGAAGANRFDGQRDGAGAAEGVGDPLAGLAEFLQDLDGGVEVLFPAGPVGVDAAGCQFAGAAG